MEVLNTDSTVLDMNFLLLSITMILDITLALVGRLLKRSPIRCKTRNGGRHAAVDAVRRCREGMAHSGRGSWFDGELVCFGGSL